MTLKNPLPCDLGHGRLTAFEREDQILGVQLEFLESHFLELFVFGEVGLLEQLFQTLSVAMMFGVQTIKLIAQRGNLYFVHQAPPMATQLGRSAETAIFLRTLRYIAEMVESASAKSTEGNGSLWISGGRIAELAAFAVLAEPGEIDRCLCRILSRAGGS
ncbi:MAG: hypothetical protein WAL45_13800 [Terracidiphilus sp.]